MNLIDLRYSNSVYIYRAIAHHSKTVNQIASELNTTPLTVSKILKKLCDQKFIEKINVKNDKGCGRPNTYYAPGSYYYSVLLLSQNGVLNVYYVFPSGLATMNSEMTTFLVKGRESIIANTIRGYIGRSNPRSLGIYLLSDGQNEFKSVRFMTKCDINELLINAYSDEEKSVFIEYDSTKILINHNKARFVEADIDEIKKIIDVDEHLNFKDKSFAELATDAMKMLTHKLIEKKFN